MKNYQLVLVLKKGLSEANRKKFVETLKSWLKDVKFTKEEDWGEKPLSYIIKKETSGHYLNFIFEIKDSLAGDFEKRIFTNENVLRHLLLGQKSKV